MTVTVIDGRRTVRLVLDKDGTRRVVVDGEEEASWVLGAAPRRQAAAGWRLRKIPTRLSACGRVGVRACTI